MRFVGGQTCYPSGMAERLDRREYLKQWQAANREHVRAYKQEKYERAKARIREFKASGCVDCGEMDMRCLQLDHIEGKTMKSADFLVCGDERREAELALCQVRCANCHLKRHADADTFAEAGRKGSLLRMQRKEVG